MQKKLYIGGLPWEIDRIGLLNYFKAILECNDIAASYEPAFISEPLSNPNAVIKVSDVFVAIDRETSKSRGFGFITLDMADDSLSLFEKVIELMNKRIMIGIRGPRELIVNEAEPRVENPNRENSSRSDRNEVPAETEAGAEEDKEKGFSLDW